jgi:hypothetical protein
MSLKKLLEIFERLRSSVNDSSSGEMGEVQKILAVFPISGDESAITARWHGIAIQNLWRFAL